MQTPNFIAELLGFMLIVIPLSMILKQTLIKKVIQQVANNETVLYYSGIVSFVAGLAIVLGCHSWIYTWQIIIPVLGWLILLRGLFCIFFTSIVAKLMSKITFGK